MLVFRYLIVVCGMILVNFIGVWLWIHAMRVVNAKNGLWKGVAYIIPGTLIGYFGSALMLAFFNVGMWYLSMAGLFGIVLAVRTEGKKFAEERATIPVDK